MKDLYKTLGVPESADDKAIKIGLEGYNTNLVGQPA